MKVHYDGGADALYVRFAGDAVLQSEEIRPGVVFDFDNEGRIVAIEVLDARRRLPLSAFSDLDAA